MEKSALAVREEAPTLTLAEVKAQVQLIRHVLESVMKEGTHYGTIPGTPKPSLWKPGAEKVLSTFKIAVTPRVEDLSDSDCVHYRIEACARHYVSGTELGSAFGEASSDEEKYKWRAVVCDEEWEATSEDRRRTKWAKGSWDRSANKAGPARPIRQVRTEPADVANTILKMASKRAEVAVTLRVTGASDVFTQDLEDLSPELLGTIIEAQVVPPSKPEPVATGAPAPAPAPTPAPAPGIAMVKPHPADGTAPPAGTVHLIQGAIVAKTGTSGQGPWTLYEITTKDGHVFKTFSDSVFKKALDAAELDISVRVGSKASGRGSPEIVSFDLIEPE